MFCLFKTPSSLARLYFFKPAPLLYSFVSSSVKNKPKISLSPRRRLKKVARNRDRPVGSVNNNLYDARARLGALSHVWHVAGARALSEMLHTCLSMSTKTCTYSVRRARHATNGSASVKTCRTNFFSASFYLVCASQCLLHTHDWGTSGVQGSCSPTRQSHLDLCVCVREMPMPCSSIPPSLSLSFSISNSLFTENIQHIMDQIKWECYFLKQSNMTLM